MEKVSDQENKYQEDGEEQLELLIKEAGEEARTRRREALNRHFEKLQAAIAEGVARW